MYDDDGIEKIDDGGTSFRVSHVISHLLYALSLMMVLAYSSL
jgi:hypothetical protein